MERLPHGFRAGLRRELPRWREEGLVGDEAAARLAVRYALEDPALAGPDLAPVYALGALLVGAGVVSLVAWHWDEMARATRLALICGAVVAAHLGGASLRRDGRHPRLGEAVTLLGSLLFGAGVALVAQLFQVSGPWYGLFGAFAAGALAAGLLLDSPSTLVAAAISGVALWASGWSTAHPGRLGAVTPYLAALPFLAAGWRRRSRPLLAVAALALVLAVLVSTGGALWGLPPLALSVALLAAPLLARGAQAPLAAVLGGVGWYAFAALGFALSHVDAVRALRFSGRGLVHWDGGGVSALAPAAALGAGLLAAGLVRRGGGPRARATALVAGGAALALSTAVRLEAPLGGAAAANAALAVLAVLRIGDGLATLRRRPFWEGVALAALLLVARFLEIERLLWLKGLGFIGCGVAVTWAALAFERRRTEAPGDA